MDFKYKYSIDKILSASLLIFFHYTIGTFGFIAPNVASDGNITSFVCGCKSNEYSCGQVNNHIWKVSDIQIDTTSPTKGDVLAVSVTGILTQNLTSEVLDKAYVRLTVTDESTDAAAFSPTFTRLDGLSSFLSYATNYSTISENTTGTEEFKPTTITGNLFIPSTLPIGAYSASLFAFINMQGTISAAPTNYKKIITCFTIKFNVQA